MLTMLLNKIDLDTVRSIQLFCFAMGMILGGLGVIIPCGCLDIIFEIFIVFPSAFPGSFFLFFTLYIVSNFCFSYDEGVRPFWLAASFVLLVCIIVTLLLYTPPMTSILIITLVLGGLDLILSCSLPFICNKNWLTEKLFAGLMLFKIILTVAAILCALATSLAFIDPSILIATTKMLAISVGIILLAAAFLNLSSKIEKNIADHDPVISQCRKYQKIYHTELSVAYKSLVKDHDPSQYPSSHPLSENYKPPLLAFQNI